MSKKETIWAAAFLIVVWLGHLLAPHIISLTGALGGLVAMAAYPIGSHFRRKCASALQVMPSAEEQSVFPVQRRGFLWLGYFSVVLGVAALALIWVQKITEVGTLLATPFCLFAGVFLILWARNVREIHVDDHQIQFLPVGVCVKLDEVIAIKAPQGDAPTHIELTTKTTGHRYVPGVLLAWDGVCKLTLVGSNGDAVLSALHQRLPSA